MIKDFVVLYSNCVWDVQHNPNSGSIYLYFNKLFFACYKSLPEIISPKQICFARRWVLNQHNDKTEFLPFVLFMNSERIRSMVIEIHIFISFPVNTN